MAFTYKLSYFDITALGEPIRYMLSYADFNFKDNRVDIRDWPSIKLGTPFGQLPTLEYDGKIATQCTAICRYIAKQCQLTGRNDWDDLQIDAAVGTIDDLRMKFAEYYYEQDDNLKEKKAKVLFGKTVPFYLDRLEKQVKNNCGYFAVPYLTWADIVFTSLLEYMNFMAGIDIIQNYRHLEENQRRVVNISNIKKWLERRPKDTLLNPKYFEPTK